MRKLLRILVVFFTLAIAVSAIAAIPIEVAVGKGTVVTLKKKAKRVMISDPSVAELLMLSPSEIALNGKKTGATSLIIWDEEGSQTFFDVMVYVPKEESPSEAPQVLLEVKVTQIDRTKLRELGIGFLAKGSTAEGSVGTSISPSGALGGAAGTDITPGITGYDLGTLAPQIGVSFYPAGVSAVIRALSEKGLAKILAEPNLVVRSGERGSFLAGSRVPIQQVLGAGASQTVSIVYEEVGIKLNFAPQVLEDGTIRLKIDPAEVSNIARFLTFGSIVAPQIDTREVRTSVDLKEGESLVLAGLLNEEMKKNIQKIPILGDIPILGAIFRSSRDEIEKTELAFFITPRLVKPLPKGEKTELKGEKLIPGEQKDFNWIPIPGGSGGEGDTNK